MESVRAMLIARDLPLFLWGEAVSTTVYVLNRTPNRNNQHCTPFEAWTGKNPSLTHLRTFGAEAYVHIPKEFRKKLDKNAKKVIHVGYQTDSCNYRLYDLTTRKIQVSMNVTFNEKAPPDLTTSRVNFIFPDFHDEDGDPVDQEAGRDHDVDRAEAKVTDGVDMHHAEDERNEDAAEAGATDAP